MKRYLLFAGATYYPCEGWNNFVGSFDDKDEARASIQFEYGSVDWKQVVDTCHESGIPTIVYKDNIRDYQ